MPGTSQRSINVMDIPSSTIAGLVLCCCFLAAISSCQQIPAQDGCENLDDRHCMLPWPSDQWLIEDASTLTGWRLNYTDAMPRNKDDELVDPTPFNRLDGFSPASQIIAYFGGPLDLSAAPTIEHIERSLSPDTQTMILDLETGAQVAHWVEMDMTYVDARDSVLFIRPASRLEENHRYAVILRDLSFIDGAQVERSPAFDALFRGRRTGVDDLDSRRESYKDLRVQLQEFGLELDDITLAWWFHTASGASVKGPLTAMRDDASTRMTPEQLGCTIELVEDNFQSDSFRRIIGTFTVPWYLDSLHSPSQLVRDTDGIPIFQGYEAAPFTVMIPNSVAQNPPGRLIQFGHGFLSAGSVEMSTSVFRRYAQEQSAIYIATDWQGMAIPDTATFASALANLNDFQFVTDRLQQAMITQMALTESFLGPCADLVELQLGDGTALLDPVDPVFFGASQGAILGQAFAAFSPHFERAIFLVPGAVWSLLAPRSSLYPNYEVVIDAWYTEHVDKVVLNSLMQHLWDPIDAANWLGTLSTGSPGSPPVDYIYIDALHDSVVTNVASDTGLRIGQTPVVFGSARLPWGLTSIPGPVAGTGFLSIDVGEPAHSQSNQPPASTGGHVAVISEATTHALINHWLETNIIDVPCTEICDPD